MVIDEIYISGPMISYRIAITDVVSSAGAITYQSLSAIPPKSSKVLLSEANQSEYQPCINST